MDFLNQWWGVTKYVVTDPDTFFENYDEDHGVGYPIVYMLLTSAVVWTPLLLLSVALNATDPASIGYAVIGVGIFAVFTWIASVVEAAIAHAILYLFGARGLTETMEAYAFPMIVRGGLWWFPIVNLAMGVWGLILVGKGLMSFHDVSGLKAAFAVIVAAILYLPAIVIFAAVLATFVLGVGGGSTEPTGAPATALAGALPV